MPGGRPRVYGRVVSRATGKTIVEVSKRFDRALVENPEGLLFARRLMKARAFLEYSRRVDEPEEHYLTSKVSTT